MKRNGCWVCFPWPALSNVSVHSWPTGQTVPSQRNQYLPPSAANSSSWAYFHPQIAFYSEQRWTQLPNNSFPEKSILSFSYCALFHLCPMQFSTSLQVSSATCVRTFTSCLTIFRHSLIWSPLTQPYMRVDNKKFCNTYLRSTRHSLYCSFAEV